MKVRAGSDLVLDAAVGGRPDPKASWSKGKKELELCEKYHLQYTPTRAMAIIKFCDRDDTGTYSLTVRNVSGTKTAEVNVKVLGKQNSLTLNLKHNRKNLKVNVFNHVFRISCFFLFFSQTLLGFVRALL